MTVALVTLDQVTLAATMGDGPDAIRIEAATTLGAPAKHEQETANAHSPLTLLVQSPAGSTLRLTYIQDDGWTFDDRDASLEPTEGRVTPAAVSPQKEDTISHPLTVFIDGPSGYTYVWLRDQGWKFVGRITNQTK
ncbi:hypothetical protein [Paraburkholderia sp. ZP32-5]|uniref:hypothetical protein n=1 Tax=Paraburkholderia sp. ZP32-5 TaxID=2883245 RepID=UPI001F403576|nr:hypothetical protein [Paraburkholderia sp. ZP32-5]